MIGEEQLNRFCNINQKEAETKADLGKDGMSMSM
jgi:hypothetical protein